jgi:hypothetical protein
VQNFYNLAHRGDDDLIDSLAAQGIAYVPYFPLGGFSPLQSDKLESVATRLDATSMAVALAWLLQRSPNMLLIPGTSSIAHLRDNVSAAALTLSEDDLAELNGAASRARSPQNLRSGSSAWATKDSLWRWLLPKRATPCMCQAMRETISSSRLSDLLTHLIMQFLVISLITSTPNEEIIDLKAASRAVAQV